MPHAAAIFAALAMLGFVAYEQVEQPTNQIFGHTLTQGPSNRRVVALTFDDGPNPPYTDRILNVLEREHVKATFFLVGQAVSAYPATVRREVRDGDALGNHTWAHGHLIVMTDKEIRASLLRTDGAVYRATGLHTHLMRPPYGGRDWFVIDAARRLGYTVVMWSVPLAQDWDQPPPAVIAQRILRNVDDGSIIVLHDGNQGLLCGGKISTQICDRTNDIQATRLIVDRLKRDGYRFLTIPQLMTMRGGTMRKADPGPE